MWPQPRTDVSELHENEIDPCGDILNSGPDRRKSRAASRPMRRAIDAIRWRYPRFIAKRHDARGVSRAALYVLAGISFRGIVSGLGDRARLLAVITQLIAARDWPVRPAGCTASTSTTEASDCRFTSTASTISMSCTVCVEKQYDDLELPEHPATILDLGAHIGAALLALHVRFPQAQLAAAEADPATFRRLERNLAALPQARAVQAAVGERDGTVEFLPARDGWVSGLREMAGVSADGADDEVVAVRSVRFDTLLDELGLERADLVKVDIEGAEWPLVNSLDPARMGTMIMEWHADLHGHEPDQLVALLPDHHVLAEALPSPSRFIVTAWPR